MTLDVREFVRFLMAGGLASLCNITARIALNLVMPFEAATAIAYLIGMAVAYTIMRRYVFSASGRSLKHEVSRFVLVNVIGFTQVMVIAEVLYRIVLPMCNITRNAEAISHILAIGSLAATSYLLHKFFSFSKTAK